MVLQRWLGGGVGLGVYATRPDDGSARRGRIRCYADRLTGDRQGRSAVAGRTTLTFKERVRVE
jgi:hypothetical protein